MDVNEFDVIIVGAGISGACTARELSKTDAKICILDSENDVGCGSSKANSGIAHSGYDPEPGTLMARLNVRGAALLKELSTVLDYDYRQIGSLVLAFDAEGDAKVKKLLERGRLNGVGELSILTGDEVRKIEPNVSEEVTSALYSPTAAVISPYMTTWAFAENAVMNGVSFLRNTKVHAIEKKDGMFFLDTGGGLLKSRFVVNAAGLNAGKISQMAGARRYTIVQRKGEYSLLDSRCGNLVRHVLFQTPGPLGKGVLVTRTVDGNILIGPSADELAKENLGYSGTTAAAQASIMKQARLSVPEIPARNIINSFAGIRAIAFEEAKDGSLVGVDDFIIEEDENVSGFINVGGICSPGLTSAPAIGEYVREILHGAGLPRSENKNFIHERKGIPSFKNASHLEKSELIKKDRRFGQIVCRCEMITEGEIAASLNCPLGAMDLDGVKRRTRAGMGRCQSGFCSPRVTEIISRELGIPMVSVTKKGGTSYVLDSKTRATVPDFAVGGGCGSKSISDGAAESFDLGGKV